VESKDYASDYSLAELMCITAAKEIQDKENILMGLGLPCLAATVAKMLYVPGAQIFSEVGVFDWVPRSIEDMGRAPLHISDMPLFVGSAMLGDMLDQLGSMLMGGRVDTAFLGGAQIDKLGNLNTISMGDYHHPTRRLGGTGGNTDAACLAKKVITILPHEKRRFVERVDFLSSPGYIDGPGGRLRHGLKPQGPNVVISTLGILRFDTPDGEMGSCEMYLDSIFPNVSVDTVKEMTGWDLKVSDELKQVDPPTMEEVILLRTLDPLQFHLGYGRY
jgi:glutaconate CoA-transferase, subunit B